jgi:hypothetical protein
MYSDWQYRTSPSAAWQTYPGGGEFEDRWNIAPQVDSSMDGYEYRVRLYNGQGEVYSRAAAFSYGTPRGPISDLLEGEWRAPTGWFMIYRNGKYIGKTYENFFVDAAAIGNASYEVLQVLPGGYYTRGTVVQGNVNVQVDCPALYYLKNGVWAFIPANYSNDEQQEITITRRRYGQRVYYSGAKYPVVELSEHEEFSANFSTFWLDGDDANADKLEALLGEQVMLKTPKGRLIVGVLDSLPIVDSSWRRFYTIQLSQSEWEDFTDVT